MPQYIPGDMGRPPGKSLKKARNELVSKLATTEEESMGMLPTSLVYSSALAASDDTEAARWAVIIARELDLPAPRPPAAAALRRRKPESIVDPYTGKAVSQGRAQSLMGLGSALGDLLATPERILPKRRPVSGQQVAAYVNAADFVPDVSAEFALGQALEMERRGTPIDKLRQNLAVAAEFNETAGAWTDEEVLVYARWWAENKDRVMTRGDLVTLSTPELTNAITEHKQKINTNPYALLAEGQVGEEIFYSDLNKLVAARDAAINDVSLLDDARRILHEVETPSWGDRVTAWVGREIFDPLFKASQRIFVEGATLPVMALKLGEAAWPGGSTLGDAIRTTQRDRSYFIQRINGGSSIGEVYAENGMVPSWVGAGMDFAVGWIFDPLIVGGATLTTLRASKVAPGLIRVPGVVGLGANRILRDPRIFEWSARRFSTSKLARNLAKAAYKGDNPTELLQQIDRLATHFEARSPLDYQFMLRARERLKLKYPTLNEKAYAEWAEMLQAHFGIRPRPGSLAEEVVRLRQGQAATAEEALLHQPSAMIAGRQYVESPSGAMVPRAQAVLEAEEVIANGTIPLSLASEIPHRLIGTGVRRSTMVLRETRLAQGSLGRRIRAGFTPNPGNIYRLGDQPERYLYRRGLRWREFTEDELRAYQARAVEIRNSGSSVERRLIELRDEMDSEALLRIAKAHGVPDDVSGELLKEINRHTRQLDQGQVFGAIEQGAGVRVRTTPIMEAQLVNEAFSADPVLLRKVMNRYQGTVRDYVKGAVNNLGAHVTPEAMEGIARLAYRGTDFAQFIGHGVMRTWKFMVVPRPAYIGRVILLEEGGRWLATTGSVLDRILAQELKLGVGPFKYDLGRRLDERGIGQIVVPVGDRKIVLPRIGAQDYEPLANQVFRTEDLLDDAMRHALSSEVANSASGHYGVIDPSSAQYSTIWERMLNKQFGNSASGIKALESVAAGNDVRQTTQILRRWAGKEGFIATRSRIGLRGEDIPEWADDLARMAHAYTGENAQIATAAIARTINRDMLRLIPDDMRAPIHGPLLDRLTAATGPRNTVRSLTDAVYNAMVRWPESVLNRQPYYKYWKRQSTESYYRALDGQGYEKLEIVETVGKNKLSYTLDPTDAAWLQKMAKLDTREFLRRYEERLGEFVRPLDIRRALRQNRVGTGEKVDLNLETEAFRVSAESHGISMRPGVLFTEEPSYPPTGPRHAVLPPEKKDLGNGVWRYREPHMAMPDVDYGGLLPGETLAYGVYDGDELQAWITIPRHPAGPDQPLAIDVDSIMLRARAGASEGATARLLDAVINDIGPETAIHHLIWSQIPVTRKGALFLHRRIKAIAKANEPVITRTQQIAKPITPQIEAAIDKASREFALGQVKKIMFDFAENTRLGEMAASVLPFVQPWLESYQVWGHIFVHRNPSLIGYVNQLGRLGHESGFIRRDEDGVLTIPWSWHSDVLGMLPWFNQLPEGFGMSAPLSGLNIVFGQTGELAGLPVPLPGLSPWAGLALKQFFRETENPFLTSYLFQYGFGTPVVPIWMERAARVIKPDAFNDDRLESVAMDFLKWYQIAGTDRFTNEAGEVVRYSDEVLKERAMMDARRVQGLLGVTGFFSLTAGKFQFPEEFREREEELQDLIDQFGPSVAFDTFHERYPELGLFTVGKTVTANVLGGQEAPRLPSTEYVDRLLSSPGFEDFAQQYPAWAIGLVLSKDEDFSLEVFGKSVHEGAVRYRSIDEFLLAGQSTGFWEAIDALSSWYYPKREALEARGLDEENPLFQENELRRRQELYEIWLRYPRYAQDQGVKPVEVTSGNQVPEATWESLGAQPPKTIVYSQVRQILEMDSVAEFPAIQGLKAYMMLRDPIEEEMIRRGIDSIDDDTAVRLGLKERFEVGTAEIIESFPDAEQLIDTFFRNDLEGTRESPTTRLAERDPEKYEAFTRFDVRLENLNDKAFGMATGDARDQVFANIRDHINESYRKGESWKMRMWFRNKSASGRSQYMTTLQGRPSVFYSRFDWELMGVKLTDRAQGWLDRVNVTREYIDQRIDQEVRGGEEFLSGDAFDSLDGWVKAHLGKDKTFDAAIEGMRTWGWAAFQPESELVTQKGKAGWAWRYLRDLVGDVNRQIMAFGMHGPDSFDSADAKQSYVEARDAIQLHLEWLRAKSAVFDEQVDDFQRSALRGDPFLEWLMPDTYYPIGVTGD